MTSISVESSPALGPPAAAVAAAGRSEHAIVHVDSLQRVYLVGGVAGSNGRVDFVCGLAYYNLVNSTWSTASLVPCADTANTPAAPGLRSCSSVLFRDVIYIFGGLLANGAVSDRVYRFRPPPADDWDPPHTTGIRGYYRGVAAASDSSIYLFGGSRSASGAPSNVLEQYEPSTGSMSTVVVDSSVPGTLDPAIAYDRGSLFVLTQGDAVFSYNIDSAMWKRRKSSAGAGSVARGRGALGALSQQTNQIVAFGGFAPPFMLTANDLDPTVTIQSSAQAFPANTSYQFALVSGQFMFLSHGGALGDGTTDQTMRFAKLSGIGQCASGQLMCTAPETCWNKRIAPFQDCVAPTGSTPAPRQQLYFCLKADGDAREQACNTAKASRSLSAGTKLGPFDSIMALPTGCDGQQWLPLQTEASLVYVPLADTIDCDKLVLTTEPAPAMIGSLPFTEGIIAIAVGCGLGVLLCCLIIVCIVRNRKFSDDDGGHSEKGRSSGADHRTAAIEMKHQPGLSKGYSSQSLSHQLSSTGDRGSIDDSFPSYSTAHGTAPQRALTQGYMPTDAFSRSSEFAASSIIERSALQLRGEIGRGGYGVVYKGDLRGMQVAVKCIGEGLSAKDRQDFEQEAKLLQSLPPHENVVRLIGVAYDGQSPMIVLEYLAGGSLIDLLESSIKIGRPQIVDWLRGVSAGMVHLRNHNIIHRDLAARNVMLGARGEPKVTDFGMSRFVENTADAQHVTASSVGPLKWMSPQSLLDKVWNEKSDVWAFGVLMYEVIAREEPYADLEPVQVAAQVCRDGITLEPPTTFGHDLVELLRECMRWEDTSRPTFRQINQTLMGMSRV